MYRSLESAEHSPWVKVTAFLVGEESAPMGLPAMAGRTVEWSVWCLLQNCHQSGTTVYHSATRKRSPGHPAESKAGTDSCITLLTLCKVSACAGRSKLTLASPRPGGVGWPSTLRPGAAGGRVNSGETDFAPETGGAAPGNKAAGLIAKFAWGRETKSWYLFLNTAV